MRSSARLALLLVTWPLCSLAQAPNPALQRAEQQLQALRYRDAFAALEEALASPDNDRATLLHLLELHGVTAAALERSDTAVDSFRRLLVLEPTFTLPPEHAPRIQAAFAAAKVWLASAGPLRFEARLVPGRRAVEARVLEDPLGMARRVRFQFLSSGDRPHALGGELEGARVEVELPSDAQAGWWAELLGDRDGVLAQVGSAEAPLALQNSEPPPPAPAPLLALLHLPHVERPWRWAAYGLWGAGGATVLVGTAFGLRARAAGGELAAARRDGQGRVVGLTQVQARALQARSAGDAAVANVLFGTGAALGLAGAGAWWWDERLQLVPSPGGVAVAGVLP